MHLGDLGAEVIKVEPPGGKWAGDLGPPFLSGVAASFLGMNRNKGGVVVALKQPGGAEVVLQLAEQCDVALENFRPGCRRSAGHRLQGHGGPTFAWYMAPSRPSAGGPPGGIGPASMGWRRR